MERRNLKTLLAQIFPFGIHQIDQHFFFASAPFFELLFSGYSVFDIMTALIPDKFVYIVFTGKPFKYTVLMFIYPSGQIVCDAYV